jgi:INO80 complex subunit Ies4
MSSSSNTISPPAQNGRPDKSHKPSKIVVLKLPAAILGRFLPKPTPQKNSKVKSTPSSASTPTGGQAAVTAPASSNNGDVSESNATPAPGTTEPLKKKGGGAKAGTKRSLGQAVDGAPKARGKPGPKKKPRLYVIMITIVSKIGYCLCLWLSLSSSYR